jgi:hypothetical protein
MSPGLADDESFGLMGPISCLAPFPRLGHALTPTICAALVKVLAPETRRSVNPVRSEAPSGPRHGSPEYGKQVFIFCGTSEGEGLGETVGVAPA